MVDLQDLQNLSTQHDIYLSKTLCCMHQHTGTLPEAPLNMFSQDVQTANCKVPLMRVQAHAIREDRKCWTGDFLPRAKAPSGSVGQVCSDSTRYHPHQSMLPADPDATCCTYVS